MIKIKREIHENEKREKEIIEKERMEKSLSRVEPVYDNILFSIENPCENVLEEKSIFELNQI